MEKYTSSENYLYMIHYCDPPITIENFDNSVDYTILIIFIVSACIFGIILIIVIVCCCKRCKNKSDNGVLVIQGQKFSVTPVTPYDEFPPNCPVAQPHERNFPSKPNYYSNNQYNQVNPEKDSDIRSEQTMKQTKI